MKRTLVLLLGAVVLILACVVTAQQEQQAQQPTTTAVSDREPDAFDDTLVEIKSGKLTRELFSELKLSLTEEQETALAENYVLIAAQLREIYQAIPESMQEQEIIELREQVLALISFFTRKSDHPGADMLKYSLMQSVTAKLNESGGSGAEKKSDEEADSEWITAALNIASTAMNIANNIGTYHEKISKVGNFISNQVSNTLDKVGLKQASGWAKNLGNGITKFSNEKIAPTEMKIAKKIAPVVKSAPFQAVRRTLNVVTGVMSIKSGLNMIGLAKNVKLPTSYSALKTSIKSSTKAAKAIIRNKQARQRFLRIAKVTGKRAYRTFRKADLKTKYKSIKSIYSGAKSVKGALTFKRRNNSKPSKSSQRRQQHHGRRQNSQPRRNNGRSSQRRRNNRSSQRRRNSNGSRRRSNNGQRRNGSMSSRRRSYSPRSSSRRSSGRSYSQRRRRSSPNANRRSSSNRRYSNGRRSSVGSRSSSRRSYGRYNSGRGSSSNNRRSSNRSSIGSRFGRVASSVRGFFSRSRR